MLRYFHILQYYIHPQYKKLKKVYLDDVASVIKYLSTLNINDSIHLNYLSKNAFAVTSVLKIFNFTAYKVTVDKKWDLRKKFAPLDIVWLLVDENNKLKVISYDQKLFYTALKYIYIY